MKESRIASCQVRAYLEQRLECLRLRLARYREGDRLGNGDAAFVLAELLRLRSLAPLADLPAGAGTILAGGTLEAWALARSLLRFEALLRDGDAPPVNTAVLDRHWRQGMQAAARSSLRGFTVRALSRLAAALARKTPAAAMDRLDEEFRRCGAPLAFLGLERPFLALLRCQAALYRAPAGAGFAAAQGEAAAFLERLAAALNDEADSAAGLAAIEPKSSRDERLPEDAELAALARREFARLARELRPRARGGPRDTVSMRGREECDACAKGGECRVQSRMLRASYKLRLHCRTLGLAHFACAADAADRLLLAHWNAQAPLGRRAALLLREFAALLLRFTQGRVAKERALLMCELALLRMVTRRRGGEALQEAGMEPGSSPPPLPMLMPRHLALLPTARPQWFEGDEDLPPRLPALLRELEFLEQGAARLRVYRVETLAAALHELYLELLEAAGFERKMDSNEWEPGERRLRNEEPCRNLLIDAHQRLRAMLNQAAAWQEVSPAPDLAAALRAWVNRRRCSPEGEGSGHSLRSLRPLIHRHAALLCRMLDRQAHLEFSGSGSLLSAVRLLEARRAAEALLRLVLMRPDESPWRRRAEGKTAAMNLRLCLAERESGLTLTLEADHGSACPEAHLFLRRQLGRPALEIEADGRRCRYRLLLVPSPGARAGEPGD